MFINNKKTIIHMNWFAPSVLPKDTCDLTAKQLFNTVDPKRWVSFTLSVIALYIVIYTVASLFDWERDIKKPTAHFYQLLYIILLTNFLFYFGNFNNTFSTWFLAGMFIGGLGIALIGTIPGFQFSTGSLTSLTGVPLFTVLAFAGLFIAGAYFTFKYYQKCNMTNIFFILLFVPIAILILGLGLAALESSEIDVHLHHWQWAILFVFFARFPGIPWQSLLTGIFVGIIIDGISRYGPDPLFEPST
jgi:hypothetical protein